MLANALSETLGLGVTALVGAGLIAVVGGDTGVFAALLLAGAGVLAGTFVEGTVVGTAQWLVLRRPLPRVSWMVWTVATAAGAFVAWTLGIAPSTILSFGDGGGQGSAEDPGRVVVYGLAFLLGLALGPVLGFAQWLVLRGHVRRAGLWMPANALAWAFGMVVVFVGADLIFAGGFVPVDLLLLVPTLAVAGAGAGAIHGLALVWLLRSRLPGGRVR